MNSRNIYMQPNSPTAPPRAGSHAWPAFTSYSRGVLLPPTPHLTYSIHAARAAAVDGHHLTC
jgi:hypothetical protein